MFVFIAVLINNMWSAQYKDAIFEQYRDSHDEDMKVSRLSYLYDGNPIYMVYSLYSETGPRSGKGHLTLFIHDDISWKHFLCHWPFVRGIRRSPVNSLHKGQWRGALMFSLICAWINDWVNNRGAGDLRSHSAHYDVTVMFLTICFS